MKFSEHFKIKRTLSDDWFDVVLSLDTLLFLDPFLLYEREREPFIGSHDEIIRFFNRIFKLIAQAKGEPSSLRYQQAVDSLRFPEVEELCLGYTQAGTGGSGSGISTARVIAEAIWEAIQAGIEEITHFEEISILRKGLGADHISDTTAGLIRRRLVDYTGSICERHNIPTETRRYRRGLFDQTVGRWKPINATLPVNPYNAKPVLLVPEDYLRELPTINPQDFWDHCFSNENDTLRREFSQDVTRNVSKPDIVRLARAHPQFVQDYVREAEARGGSPYDLHMDRKGLVAWYDATLEYCKAHELSLEVKSQKSFFDVVDKMVAEFQHYIEQNEGWKLLWNDNGTSRNEKAAQRLFLGIVKQYCEANNIDVSREPNIGRGPVDFKVSHGYALRALIEVKLARNTKFWNGLEKQLPTYQNAEGVEVGYFIVIAYTDKDLERIIDIQKKAREVNRKTGYKIHTVVVDASEDKPSASLL